MYHPTWGDAWSFILIGPVYEGSQSLRSVSLISGNRAESHKSDHIGTPTARLRAAEIPLWHTFRVLGRDHALSGAFAFAALAPEMHVSGAYLAAGIALSAGAGVLPDIDHPDSSIALTFGFLTNSFSWLV